MFAIEFLMDVIESNQLQASDSIEASASNTVSLNCAAPIYDQNTYNRSEVKEVLKKFGFSDFREGQEEAMKRILCGKY